MTDFVYDAEARGRDAAIARATGWRQVQQGEDGGVWFGFPPEDSPHRHRSGRAVNVPQYHTDRDVLADALAWCAKQSVAVRFAFAEKLDQLILVTAASATRDDVSGQMTWGDNYWQDVAIARLTAPPHVLAQALAAAIEEGER